MWRENLLILNIGSDFGASSFSGWTLTFKTGDFLVNDPYDDDMRSSLKIL